LYAMHRRECIAISVTRVAVHGLVNLARNTNRSGPMTVKKSPTKRNLRYSGDGFFTAFEI